MKYIAYTDGSYKELGDKKVYGSAAIFRGEEDNAWSVLSFAGTDEALIGYRNVAGELLAVVELCKILMNRDEDIELTINYDYLGVEKWACRLWKAKNTLTQEYCNFMWNNAMQRLHITFNYVEGHKDEGNKLVDSIVKKVVDQKMLEV